MIQKQYVEVVSNGDGDGIALQKDTEAIIREDLLPRLGVLFDGLIPRDRVLVIDHLLVDIKELNQENFDREFSNLVLEHVGRQLKEHLESIKSEHAGIKGSSITERKMEALCYYLEKGYFPWWSNVKSATDWETLLNEIIDLPAASDSWNAIKHALSKEVVRTRFLYLFKESSFWEVIRQMKVQGKTELILFEDDLHLVQLSLPDIRLRMEIEMKWKELVLKYCLSIISETELLNELNLTLEHNVKRLSDKGYSLRKSLFHKELKQFSIPKEGRVVRKIEKREDLAVSPTSPVHDMQEIYLANAGLVIISPYLPMFFGNMQLCEGSLLKQTDKAVALLHFLVYGTDRYEELECTLSKILCGMQPEELILGVGLTKKDIEEADALLAAVISHWQVLKNTSPDGLRESFLQREGRLLFRDNEWQLTVQRKTHDILLGHLPWNINMIKLPWMNHLLKVDWN